MSATSIGVVSRLTIDDYEDLPIDVLPVGTDYGSDAVLPRHSHRRAQLLYGSTGVMDVETDDGRWIVPAERAVLIPPSTPHRVHMHGVSTWSVYIDPGAVPWWPASCMVIEVEPLLREILGAVGRLSLDSPRSERDSTLIALMLHEISVLAPSPFDVVLPECEPLRGLCRAYIAKPDVGVSTGDWAATVSLSTRTFDRRFREQTGVSAAVWRTRARLLAALPMLVTETVTEVSVRLGYSSPASFTAAFTKAVGSPPSAFRGARRDGDV